MAGNHTLGTIRGTIEIDYNGAGIVRANRDVDKAKEKSEGLEGAVDRLGRVYAAAAKRAAIMGATSLALAGTMNTLGAAVSAVAALAPVATAALATIPGVVLAGGAAMAVFKAATSGLGDAFKAATEDEEKFKEAIKGLPPEAQKLAIAFRGALQTLKPMQQVLQNTFTRGLGPEVTRLATGVLSLRSAAVRVADAFNFIAKTAAGSIKDIQFEELEMTLKGVAGFLNEVARGIKPLIQGFISLGSQLSEFGEGAGSTVADWLTKLGNAMKNFDLASAFEDAQGVLSAVGGFLKDLWSIAKSLFSVFNVDGAGALGVIGQLTSDLAAFLQTAEGKEALAAIGEVMRQISGAAGQVFLALLKALAPAIIALAPGIGQLATQLAAALVPAINAAAPLLEMLAGFIARNMDWLGPLIIAVGAGVVAFKAYSGVLKAVTAAKALWNSRLITALGNVARLTAAVVVNTARMAANAAVVGGKAVAAWARNAAAMAVNLARTAALNAAVGVQMVAAFARQAAAVVASTAVMVAQRVAMVAGIVVVKAMAAAQMLWNAAMSLNPIGLVIIAIVALVAAIVILWNKSETFRKVVIAVWEGIKAGALAVVNWFKDTALPFLAKVWNGIVSGVTAMKDRAVALFNLWWSGVQKYINMIKNVITTVVNAITAYIRWWVGNFLAVVNGIGALVGKFKAWFGSIVSAIKAQFDAAVNLAKGLIGRVLNALGNVGSRLYNAGKSLIQGFINGIKDMIGQAGNAAKAVVNKVTGFFPGSPAKEGPLSGRGYVLLRARRFMDDFATGIEQGSQLPVQATQQAVGGVGSSLTGLTSQRAVQPTTRPTPPPDAGMGGGRSVSIANLNLRGVWDFTDPTAARGVVATLHDALDRYEKEHA